MSTFALWFQWRIWLEDARRAVKANIDPVHHLTFFRAYMYALRRCEGLERAMTCN